MASVSNKTTKDEMTEWFRMKEKYVPLYLASLNEEERIGHEIAVEMLATSYSVERTRGFRAWISAMKGVKK
jgi:hypothetical protein